MSPMERQDVSPDQETENKLHRLRKRWARRQHVSSKEPNPLVESRTHRDPLIPQPEPDTDGTVPMILRPSRSKTDENIAESNKIGESRTGGEDAPHTHTRHDKRPAPEPGPQVVDPVAVADKEQAAESRRRSRAAKKAAATRKANAEAAAKQKKRSK